MKQCNGGWGQSASNCLNTKRDCAVYEQETSEECHPRRGTVYHTSQPSIRYLGVMLDARLSFKSHVEHAAAKAAKVATALTMLMPKIGGPPQPRRKLLASVVTSILTYEIAIWGEALKIKECRRKIAAVNRLSALRVSCAFLRYLTWPCVLSRE